MDLAFFPTPLSKSTYSPVSGLKVVRHPNINDSDPDSASTPTSVSSSGSFHHVNVSGLSPGMTMTAGPSPMPAPPLLEAINRNSLAVFLLVRFGPILAACMLIYVGCSCRLARATAGERSDWGGEPVDADDVCTRYPCYVCVGRVRVGCARTTGAEAVKRTCDEDGILDGGSPNKRTRPCELQAPMPGLRLGPITRTHPV